MVAGVCDDLRAHVILRASDGKSAGHWIQQERAEEVNEHLASFLAQTRGRFCSDAHGGDAGGCGAVAMAKL